MANGDGQGSPVLKYAVAAILGGVGTSVLAAIVGVITSAYVEISFKEPSTIASWREWMDLHVDLIKPKILHAYYGENDNGKTRLVEAIFTLRYFSLTNKILGTKVRQDDRREYAINGFWKDEQIVLTHRGLASGGEAVYILKLFPLPGIDGGVLSGYEILEDWKHSASNEDWIIKCPILMLNEGVAKSKYQDKATITTDFPFMNTKCVEFPMPASLTTAVIEGKSIDDILTPKK
jgi:hypothetical protein